MVRLVGSWQVTAVNGAEIPVDSPHAPWLTFDGDGQVYGMSGVNRVRGTFVVEGDTVAFGPMASTMMAGPDDAARIEAAVLAAFVHPLSVELPVAGAPGAEEPPLGRLTLVGDGGRLDLVRSIAQG